MVPLKFRRRHDAGVKPIWITLRQWDFVADMNHDGLITISDVGLWFKWFYFYPGDFVISGAAGTGLGAFLELNANSFSGFGSGVISFLIWVFMPVMVIAAFRKSIRDIEKQGEERGIDK